MDKITLSAPAKINLNLLVTGLRDDGYHLLSGVMQSLSLADTVTVEKIQTGIVISCSKTGIPLDERNICHKAAKLYLEEAGLQGGVKITLIKAIPDGAGMGGGSSDGAAVLKAMKALYPASVDLPAIAIRIGADVPFFLTGGTCICEGIGEKLTPIPFPCKSNLYCVVAKNCEGLSTPRIYKLFDELTRDTFSQRPLYPAALNTPEQVFDMMQNDLELSAISVRPEIAEMKATLLNFGADAAMMTGSGSAVFGLFLSREKAQACEKALQNEKIEAHFCTLTD